VGLRAHIAGRLERFKPPSIKPQASILNSSFWQGLMDTFLGAWNNLEMFLEFSAKVGPMDQYTLSGMGKR